MKRIPWLFLLLLGIALTHFPADAAAATCEAYGFENLKTLLKDVSKCPDPKAPGRYYVELRLNSYIDAPLVIPAKTTIRGNLLSDPGKPAALESNFNPDDAYQAGFNMFKQGKTPPPDCLITLSDESALANIRLTKIYAKNGICANSNSIIVNVEVQGPDLDMKEPFVGIMVSGVNNKFSGVAISAIKGIPISYAADKNQFTGEFVANIDTYLYGDSIQKPESENKAPENKAPAPPPSDSGAPAAVDINKQLICPAGQIVLPNGSCGTAVAEKTNPNLNSQPTTLNPLQPLVASPDSGASGCSLTTTATAASPVLAFLAIITLTGLVAYRSQPKKIRVFQKETRDD